MHAKRLIALAAVSFSVRMFAQSTPPSTPVIVATGTTIAQTATISLGAAMPLTILTVPLQPLPPQPPYTLVEGTHLQIAAPTDGIANPVVTWYKNGKPLAASGNPLDIPRATKADSGYYTAIVVSQDGKTVGPQLDTAFVLVTNAGQRLTNASTRAHIDPSQPSFLSGFVVEQGPRQAMVLIRAVGPTLSTLGVADPLAAPQFRVFDATGREYAPSGVPSTPPVSSPYHGTDAAAARVGAFPLPAGSKDAAAMYLLPPGAYVVQVSSANNGAGTVLVEVYEVPL